MNIFDLLDDLSANPNVIYLSATIVFATLITGWAIGTLMPVLILMGVSFVTAFITFFIREMSGRRDRQ